METLLKDIDDLVSDIRNDTTCKKMPELGVKLIELSKNYAEAKQEYIRIKNEYDREIIMKMESRKQYLEKQEDIRYTKEREIDPKKAKRNKITNVEVENCVNLEMIGLRDKVAEAQMTQVYLEPIVKSYYEMVQMVKFITRDTIQTERSF